MEGIFISFILSTLASIIAYCILHMQMVRKTEQATLKHKKRRAATLRFLYSNGIRVFISFIVSQVYYDLYSLSRTDANPLFSL